MWLALIKMEAIHLIQLANWFSNTKTTIELECCLAMSNFGFIPPTSDTGPGFQIFSNWRKSIYEITCLYYAKVQKEV